MNLLEVCAEYEKYAVTKHSLSPEHKRKAIIQHMGEWPHAKLLEWARNEMSINLYNIADGDIDTSYRYYMEHLFNMGSDIRNQAMNKTAADPVGPDRGFGFHPNGEPKGAGDDEHDAARERSKQRYRALREAYDQAKKNFCGGLKRIAEKDYNDDRKTIRECVENVQRHCANTLMVIKDLERPDWDTMTHNDR